MFQIARGGFGGRISPSTTPTPFTNSARHAFREKRTVLIRYGKESLPLEAKLGEVPFNVKTDRYFEYDLNNLTGSRVKLIEVLKTRFLRRIATARSFKFYQGSKNTIPRCS
jgi:hypothetical protein